jgi:hypothetical protein
LVCPTFRAPTSTVSIRRLQLFDELTLSFSNKDGWPLAKEDDNPAAPKGTITVAHDSLMTYASVNDRKAGNTLDIKKDFRRTRRCRRPDQAEVRPVARRLPPEADCPLLPRHLESHGAAA